MSQADEETLFLEDDLDAYRYLHGSRKTIQGVNDAKDFSSLQVLVFVAITNNRPLLTLWESTPKNR